MKKSIRNVFAAMTVLTSMSVVVSCSSDDNSIVAPSIIEKPEVGVVSSVSIEVKDVSVNEIQFSLESKGAVEMAYFVDVNQTKGVLPIIAAEKIFKEGSVYKTASEIVVLKELHSATEYVIAAAARTKEGNYVALKEPVLISTLEEIKKEVSLVISDIMSTSESVSFKIVTENGIGGSCIVVPSSEKPTAEQIKSKGKKIDNLKGESTFKFEKLSPNTDYKIYAVVESELGVNKIVESEIKTKVAEVSADGSINFQTIEVMSENAGWISIYVMSLKNSEWEANFEIGDFSEDLKVLPTGKYVFASWSTEEASAGAVGRYLIKDLKKGQEIKDLDEGVILISKEKDIYTISVDIARDKENNFKGVYKGNVSVTPY